MTEAGTKEELNQEELSPIEVFLEVAREELEQVRKEHKEIGMLVEQSQGEVEKLGSTKRLNRRNPQTDPIEF